MLPLIRVDSWDDWTRIYNDASVWQPLVDAICYREEISYRQLRSASANTNAVFLLDRAYALKIYSPFWDEFEFERTLLEALNDHEEIPVPDVLGYGHIADGGGGSWPYLITRYCEARPFSEIRGELSEEAALSLAAQLGGIVRALHDLDAGQLASDTTEQVWADVVSERRQKAVVELTEAGVLADILVGPLESLLDEAIAADLPESRSVVHGDLGADHVLCAPVEGGWTIEALIDFGDAKIGVLEYEWMPVWMGFCGRDPALARAVIDGYGPGLLVDGDFPKRAVAWTLLHDFGSDELISQWRERSQPAPIETMQELGALLCGVSILR
ncbi:MAG: aminoglycoside phosphotransferase family protein [Chloroflexi bacterium]|nr:aminoglycoside phosphotransferase family protein [Chloroflexota bacterium]